MTATAEQSMPSDWQILRQGIKNLSQYLQMAMVMNHTNQDVVGENCVCNDARGLALTHKEKMKHGLRPILSCLMSS